MPFKKNFIKCTSLCFNSPAAPPPILFFRLMIIDCEQTILDPSSVIIA